MIIRPPKRRVRVPQRSAAADAAALRHGFIDEAAALEPPPPFATGGDAPPTRPCAHAEAAALRFYEQDPRFVE